MADVTLNDSALVSLLQVKEELSIVDTDSDNYLKRVINYVSTFVANYCNRTLERADAIVENQAGRSSPHLILDRRPILTLTTVKFDGATITISNDNIKIDDATQGILYKSSGWSFSGWGSGGIASHALPYSANKLYEITYNAGYVTAQQAITGGTFAGETVTVPDDLQDAAIQMIVSRESRRAQDPGVESSGLMKYRETLRSGSFEEQFPSVAMILQKYRALLIL